MHACAWHMRAIAGGERPLRYPTNLKLIFLFFAHLSTTWPTDKLQIARRDHHKEAHVGSHRTGAPPIDRERIAGYSSLCNQGLVAVVLAVVASHI